jgi:hypothetical protein
MTYCMCYKEVPRNVCMLFFNLYINKKSEWILIHSCVASLTVSSIQNCHHQHKCIADNNVQQGVIVLILLVVDWCHGNLNFMSQVRQCSSEYPTVKVLRGDKSGYSVLPLVGKWMLRKFLTSLWYGDTSSSSKNKILVKVWWCPEALISR